MFIKNKLPLLLFVFTAIACNQSTRTQNNQTFYALKKLAPSITNTTKAVIVVDDNSCLSCNQAFAGIISKYIGRKDVLFIVSANPNKVDISPFLVPGLHNVFNDYGKTLFSDKVITASTVFMLKHDVIDTSITINPQSVGDIGAFLEESLGSKGD